MSMGRGFPVCIRGVVYPSQKAAAAALGVHDSTVSDALDRGTQDRIGLGIKGAPKRPCYINGQHWPSQAACARALGRHPSVIDRAIARGETEVQSYRHAGAAS